MRYLFVLLLFINSKVCFAQVDSIVLGLLYEVVKRETDTAVIGYTRSIDPAYYDYLYAKKGKVWDRDSKSYAFSLSKKEAEQLNNQIAAVRDMKFDSNILVNSQLVESMDYFAAYPTRQVYQFSMPVFIRNKTIALLVWKRHFSKNAMGIVETAYFKRTNKGWVRLAVLERSGWGAFESANTSLLP